MSDEVSVVFEQVEEGLFRPVRIEEDVEGHLRRARDDLSRISLEAVKKRNDESLYRIQVADDDEVTGHAGHGLFFYVMRRPEDRPGGKVGGDDVSGHITPPSP